MNIDIQVDPSSALSYLQRLSNQAPFATSKALNTVANKGQAAIRENVKANFVLRRETFILNTIKIERADRATKTKLDVTISIDRTRDVLAKFEAGGPKTARDGSNIAIPLDARRNKRDIITKSQRPRALLDSRRGQAGRIFKTATGILLRVGSMRAGTTRTLYLLKRVVVIPRRLGFAASATRAVHDNWVKDMTDAFMEAERTAR